MCLARPPADAFPVPLQVVSSALLGATAGSITGSSLADKLGRKKSFLIACLPLVLGSFLCASATSAQTMLAGRLFAGVGIGLSSALVPLYISEVCRCWLASSWVGALLCPGAAGVVMSGACSMRRVQLFVAQS